MNTLLYLSGEPGVGKTTLMSELTGRWTRYPVGPDDRGPARDWLLADGVRLSSVVAVEIGRRRDAFSGTDALPQTVIDAAEAYLTSGAAAEETNLLLAEGARLANRRFLAAAVGAGWRVILAHLAAPEHVVAPRRAARAAELGKPQQNPAWVKGRRTAAANLTDTAHDLGCSVIALDTRHTPAELRGVLLPVLGALVPL